MTNRQRRHLAEQPQAEPRPRQIPKPHQLKAATFCRENKRVVLGDEQGVGKTLAAILAAIGRTIVLCPATVKANWRREILRERPNARVLVLSGTSPGPIEDDVDFVVLNYEIAAAWAEPLIEWRPDTCIADEAHVCRNRKTARFHATRKIVWACDRRYLLTGTPIVNRPLDILALVNLLGLLNGVFGGWKAFVDRYCDGHPGLGVMTSAARRT